MNKRIYRYDIIKFILIALVIFGHCLELFRSDFVNNIYKVIYSFHMPVFIYISGRFAKKDIKKTLKHIVLPYVVFQILYLLFDHFVLGNNAFKFSSLYVPYWIMWYLFALIAYNLLIYALPNQLNKYGLIAIAISIVVSLLCGYIKGIGYDFSLSRILVFLPFYLIGYYFENISNLLKNNVKKYIKIIVFISLIILGEFYLLINKNVTYQSLYGSYDYYSFNTNIVTRLVVMIISISMICLLEIVIPDKNVKVITTIGSNTMCIYLIHGFVLRLLGQYDVFKYSTGVNLLLSIAIVLALLCLLGNAYINKVFKKTLLEEICSIS